MWWSSLVMYVHLDQSTDGSMGYPSWSLRWDMADISVWLIARTRRCILFSELIGEVDDSIDRWISEDEDDSSDDRPLDCFLSFFDFFIVADRGSHVSSADHEPSNCKQKSEWSQSVEDLLDTLSTRTSERGIIRFFCIDQELRALVGLETSIDLCRDIGSWSAWSPATVSRCLMRTSKKHDQYRTQPDQEHRHKARRKERKRHSFRRKSIERLPPRLCRREISQEMQQHYTWVLW